MPGSFLNFPFDAELFLMQWQAAQDPVQTALLNSGAVVNDATVRRLIANGSNQYTIPFYSVLGGTPENYDGNTDITETQTSGSSQTGVVYGRAHAWADRDFIVDFNSGADPMRSIVAQTAHFWAKQKQNRLVGILGGVFGITDDNTDNWDKWQLHTMNICAVQPATGSASVTEDNLVNEASAADCMQQANGDNAGVYSIAVMHSKVAANLAKLQLLSYRKYTDPNGIERQLNIADWNGLTVIVDDGVPVVSSTAVQGAKEYTTYLFGRGAILTAPAPVSVPVETGRDMKTDGGYNFLVNRLRETIHPNGFSYTLPNNCVSPTDIQLGTAAQWSLIADAKLIPIARIVSNG